MLLDDASVDACVTDPPYGLSFMGKGWDHAVPGPEVWREVFRVLKPGAHLLAFFGTRTYHRGVCAIEDAGFDVRDQIGWAFGSGFPKSHNGEWGGTALKPAWEPIVMARKPLAGTVEANWRKHGTGALNIDACRVEYAGTEDAAAAAANSFADSMRSGRISEPTSLPTVYDKKPFDGIANGGRWPANLIHDGSDEVVTLFPQSDGQQGDVRGTEQSRTGGEGTNCYGEFGARPLTPVRGDTGSAARFFYCAKADRAERDMGLSGFSLTREADREKADGAGGDNPRNRSNRSNRNHHPTVKPVDLMRYLCRLVTPKGGTVLDPFLGSGSTGIGALREGFQFIGIERDPRYVEIAKARIKADAPLFTEIAA